jgi:hypothetical protein
MDQVPVLNYTTDSAVKYLRVRDLKKLNQRDEITFDYRLLDPETMSVLKTTIDHRIKYWLDKKSYLNPKVAEYLATLFKANQGTKITIEYNKLVNDFADDILFEIVYKTHKEKTTVSQDIRGYIQRVLVERTKKLYNNMILNPGI